MKCRVCQAVDQFMELRSDSSGGQFSAYTAIGVHGDVFSNDINVLYSINCGTVRVVDPRNMGASE